MQDPKPTEKQDPDPKKNIPDPQHRLKMHYNCYNLGFRNAGGPDWRRKR